MGNDATAPLLSVVVPVYCVEQHLAACLDSIIGEADERIEVVPVDDGSPDRCGEIIDAYARRDERVHPIHLPANTGLGQARNVGLDRATGDYVWFVDGDDTLPPGSIPIVVERLSRTRPDVLIVNHAEVYDDGRVLRPQPDGLLESVPEPIPLSRRPELLRAAQSACTKVVRRDFLDEIKLRFAPGWYEDTSFSHPLLMAARRVDVLERICYHYHQRHAAGITKTVSARHFEVFDQYRRLFDGRTRAGEAQHQFRPHLFRLMIDHYLVIVGNDYRVPPELRREFFRRMAADYRARLPESGYDVPRGVGRLKHWLVRHDAYRIYAVLRRCHRVWRRLINLLGPDRWRRAPSSGASVAAPRPPSGRTTSPEARTEPSAPARNRSATPPQ